MISVGNANSYFKSHVHGDAWNEYSGEQKDLAITQARRDLSRALGRPMKDDEPPYVEGEKKRDEYAVYEQALYTLLSGVQPKGGGNPVPSLEPDERKPVGKSLSTGRGKWSIEALSWLCDKVSLVTKLS